MKEITKGQLQRFIDRAMSLFGASKYFEWASTKPATVGRRAMLKALRDFMQPMNRRQLNRAAKRRKVRHVSS